MKTQFLKYPKKVVTAYDLAQIQDFGQTIPALEAKV
jgi:hypothetical protein